MHFDCSCYLEKKKTDVVSLLNNEIICLNILIINSIANQLYLPQSGSLGKLCINKNIVLTFGNSVGSLQLTLSLVDSSQPVACSLQFPNGGHRARF